MKNHSKLLSILDELELFEQDELRLLYEEKRKLQDREDKLLIFENELYSIKEYLKEESTELDTEGALIRLGQLKILLESINGDKALFLHEMIKPINKHFIEELELDK